MYGQRWQTLNASDEELRKGAWLNVVKDLTDDQILYGIEYCSKHQPLNEKGEAWPPNAREFLEYCRMMPSDSNVEKKEKNETEPRIEFLQNRIASAENILKVYGDILSDERKANLILDKEKFQIELDGLTKASVNTQNLENKAQG